MPMTSAMIVVAVKYTNALAPTRPSRLRSCVEAMPVTIVRKTIGATTIFTRLMNVSPSGLRDFANSGRTMPSAMPMATATRTWNVRLRARVRMRAVG